MSGVDVQDLAREDLPTADFPVSSQSDFRLRISAEVHEGILKHAKTDTSIEICGVLVGHWKKDKHGPYADVLNYIRCENASSKFAEVTFTHESWAQINEEMDSKYTESRIIGWYHSHPDFGIFLSDRDCFIQENFFSGSGQVAYVVDPVRDIEGVFAWRQGKPKLLPHYWIGSNICTSQASVQSKREQTTDLNRSNSISDTGNYSSIDQKFSAFPLTTLILAWISFFLLGYLVASWKTSWERERIIQGVVAHYGIDKVLKYGLDEDLNSLRKHLRLVNEKFQTLAIPTEHLPDDQAKELLDRQALIGENLKLLDSSLGLLDKKYSFSPEQQDAIKRLIFLKHSELRKQMEKQAKIKSVPSEDLDVEESGQANRTRGEIHSNPPLQEEAAAEEDEEIAEAVKDTNVNSQLSEGSK